MRAALLFFVVLIAAAPTAAAEGVSLDPELHRLGKKRRLELEFEAGASDRERALAIDQEKVLGRWTIFLNGIPVADLRRALERKVCYYPVPAGVLRDGKNSLVVMQSDLANDAVLGNFRLVEQTVEQALGLRPLEVRVRERGTGRPLPARVTVVDARGAPAEIYRPGAAAGGVRTGLIYVPESGAAIELPEGDYVFYATRGMEWSLGRAEARVGPDGAAAPVELSLAREVDTSGFVACDPHVHTYTFSGHGDAALDERQLTLAADGVEVAVATDHNHCTDYRAAQAGAKVGAAFAAIAGDEVTTKNGHFNAFPLEPGASLPPWGEADWPKLVAGIREKGARVVILNHPRWPRIETGPFGVFGLDRPSGERARGGDFTFDALEVANAGCLTADPLYILRDWFGLLNRGARLTAVGASDSHTVGDPVGQARTYARSSTDDPQRVATDELCKRFLAGEASVSVGIFADVTVEGKYGMGALVPAAASATDAAGAGAAPDTVEVVLRAAAPGWVTPERVRVFVDGALAAEAPVPHEPGAPTDARVKLRVPLPRHDAWLVCAVTGAGIDGPFWPRQPYTFAATNPVRLDRDGDGRYSSPRETAEGLFGAAAGDPARIAAALEGCDDGVAIQLLSLARRALDPDARAKLAQAVARTRRETLCTYFPEPR